MDRIRQQLVAWIERTFDFHRTLHPSETFYAFALVGATASGEALTAVSATEETFARASKTTRPSHLGLRRFCPDEWWFDPCHPVGDDFGWRALSRALPSLCSPKAPDGVLNAMVDALAELDRRGYFGSGLEREKVTLMTYISDDPISADWWPESVWRLNPPAVVEKFTAALKPIGIAPGMPVIEQMCADRTVNWPTFDEAMQALGAVQRGDCKRVELLTPAGGRLAASHFSGFGFCLTVQEAAGALDLTLCDLSRTYKPVEVGEGEDREVLSGVSLSSREMVVAAMQEFFRTGLRSPSQTWMDWMELNQIAGIE